MSYERVDSKDNFAILSPQEFLGEVVVESKSARDRIWVQSMQFETDQATLPLAEQMQLAAKRGVDTRLHIDGFALMFTDAHYNFLPTFNSERRGRLMSMKTGKLAVAQAIRDSGGIAEFTNVAIKATEYLRPFNGRNHAKMTIIDDVAYVGGINLSLKDCLKEDFMMRFTDPGIVDAIADQFDKVNDRLPSKDVRLTPTEDTSILMDRGDRNKSIILTEGIDLIRRAEQSVKLATQFIPDGKVLQELAEAKKRGIVVSTVVSSQKALNELHGWLFNARCRLAMLSRMKSIPLSMHPQWVHAKVLLIDDAVGVIGSHNFSETGVKNGTQEIAVESSHPTFVANLGTYFASLLAATQKVN